jgi:transposase
MLDETIVTETPPLYNAYGRKGCQIEVPISGNRQKRVLHGAINIHTGATALLITKKWNQLTHRDFLHAIRKKWRGWEIVLFEDRGSPHTAKKSRKLTLELGIKVRYLPQATPELNAMDHLWKHMKKDALSNRKTESIDISAQEACSYILQLAPQKRLKKSGVLSDNFWLKY